MSGKDAAMYMIFQVIGAFIGSAILYAIVQNITAADASYIAAGGRSARLSLRGRMPAKPEFQK